MASSTHAHTKQTHDGSETQASKALGQIEKESTSWPCLALDSGRLLGRKVRKGGFFEKARASNGKFSFIK